MQNLSESDQIFSKKTPYENPLLGLKGFEVIGEHYAARITQDRICAIYNVRTGSRMLVLDKPLFSVQRGASNTRFSDIELDNLDVKLREHKRQVQIRIPSTGDVHTIPF